MIEPILFAVKEMQKYGSNGTTVVETYLYAQWELAKWVTVPGVGIMTVSHLTDKQLLELTAEMVRRARITTGSTSTHKVFGHLADTDMQFWHFVNEVEHRDLLLEIEELWE